MCAQFQSSQAIQPFLISARSKEELREGWGKSLAEHAKWHMRHPLRTAFLFAPRSSDQNPVLAAPILALE